MIRMLCFCKRAANSGALSATSRSAKKTMLLCTRLRSIRWPPSRTALRPASARWRDPPAGGRSCAQRDQPGCRKDPGLTHPAADELAYPARALDERLRTNQHRPHRRAQPFDRQKLTLSAAATSSAASHPRAAAALKMRAPSMCSARPCSRATSPTASTYAFGTGIPPTVPCVFSSAIRRVRGKWPSRSSRIAARIASRGSVPSGWTDDDARRPGPRCRPHRGVCARSLRITCRRAHSASARHEVAHRRWRRTARPFAQPPGRPCSRRLTVGSSPYIVTERPGHGLTHPAVATSLCHFADRYNPCCTLNSLPPKPAPALNQVQGEQPRQTQHHQQVDLDGARSSERGHGGDHRTVPCTQPASPPRRRTRLARPRRTCCPVPGRVPSRPSRRLPSPDADRTLNNGGPRAVHGRLPRLIVCCSSR